MAKKTSQKCSLAYEYCSGVEGDSYKCEECVAKVVGVCVKAAVAEFRIKVFDVLDNSYSVTPMSLIKDRIRKIEIK